MSEALQARIEALLIMADEPVPAVALAQAVGCPTEEVTEALGALTRFYDETGRGFELRHVGSGWRYYTRPEHHEFISAWVLEGQQAKLSQAALETLSVVAYLQPISRSRVSAIRGVNVDGVMRTLVARNLIREEGSDSSSGATLFVTTSLFLEKLGITSLDALPELAPHLPEAQALEAELAQLAEERAAAAQQQATPEESEGDAGQEGGSEQDTATSEAPAADDVQRRQPAQNDEEVVALAPTATDVVETTTESREARGEENGHD